MSPGGQHTCAIGGGVLSCWGANALGQLGDGTTTPHGTPAAVNGASDWAAVTTGLSFTCGVRSGQLWCWGDNNSGNLGDGTITPRNAPVRVGPKADWVAVDAGANHIAGSRRVPASE